MNLQTLKSEKEKVEKGCERFIDIGINKKPCSNYLLCPTCQARLEAINLGIQAVENTIKDEIEFLTNHLNSCKKDLNLNDIKGINRRLSQLQKEMTK